METGWQRVVVEGGPDDGDWWLMRVVGPFQIEVYPPDNRHEHWRSVVLPKYGDEEIAAFKAETQEAVANHALERAEEHLRNWAREVAALRHGFDAQAAVQNKEVLADAVCEVS